MLFEPNFSSANLFLGGDRCSWFQTFNRVVSESYSVVKMKFQYGIQSWVALSVLCMYMGDSVF
jgi:hypothetical protein